MPDEVDCESTAAPLLRSVGDLDIGSVLFGRYRPVDLAQLVWLALMSVVVMSGMAFPFWTPRAIVLLCVTPIGLVDLARLTWARDRAALALSAFCGWALLSGLLSGRAGQLDQGVRGSGHQRRDVGGIRHRVGSRPVRVRDRSP